MYMVRVYQPVTSRNSAVRAFSPPSCERLFQDLSRANTLPVAIVFCFFQGIRVDEDSMERMDTEEALPFSKNFSPAVQ